MPSTRDAVLSTTFPWAAGTFTIWCGASCCCFWSAIAGCWQVTLRRRALGRVLAFLYGVGAALTLDEYALWLNLQDVYWERQGRASIDAVLLFSALLTMGIVGGRFVHALAREAVRTLRRA